MGPGILPETTVGKHNPPCHLQLPTKALSCKKEAICEHGPEVPSCPWGCISAYGMDSLHVSEGTMNAERYIKVLEQHMLPSRRRLFQGRPCVFQQDNAKPHTAAITAAWLRSRRVRVLNWPACSPDLSPIANIWRIIKRKIRQRRPKTLQQLETYIRQERDQIPTPKLQKIITSMPRRLQTVLKRRGDATPW